MSLAMLNGDVSALTTSATFRSFMEDMDVAMSLVKGCDYLPGDVHGVYSWRITR